jgi:hypothetical protein
MRFIFNRRSVSIGVSFSRCRIDDSPAFLQWSFGWLF